MTKFNPNQIQWRIPWWPVLLGQEAATVAELYREMSAEHVLFGRIVQAVGNRQDCDDFLFYLGETVPQFAVVHLSFVQETSSDYPSTVLFDTLDAWVQQCMIPDAEDWNL